MRIPKRACHVACSFFQSSYRHQPAHFFSWSIDDARGHAASVRRLSGRGELPCNFDARLHVSLLETLFLGFMNVGGQELILILLIILVLFGARKLPELARGMGQAIKEFQKAKDEFSDELHSADKTDVAAKPAPSTMPTVARIENAAGDSVPGPTADATVEPGSKV